MKQFAWPSNDPAVLAVDLAGRELGLDDDALVFEQPCEPGGCDRLGERGVERRGVNELDVVADTAFAQVPVGQEAELQRCDRALDRHVDQVHDQPATVEGPQSIAKSRRALERGSAVVRSARRRWASMTVRARMLRSHPPDAAGSRS